MDGKLLQLYQRDVHIKVSKTKRLWVEVKALTPAAFRSPMVHIRKCQKWDEKETCESIRKRFESDIKGWKPQSAKVDVLILINQETGEAFAVDPHEGRTRVPSLTGSGYDYAIPRHLLSPLEAWIAFIKDSHDLGSISL